MKALKDQAKEAVNPEPTVHDGAQTKGQLTDALGDAFGGSVGSLLSVGHAAHGEQRRVRLGDQGVTWDDPADGRIYGRTYRLMTDQEWADWQEEQQQRRADHHQQRQGKR